ncbi:MAG: ABC transporter ATP-binding protein [Eubacterium sp.]|nr:ABC transporter ATP-binding protein [Eubacterium sp.]
MLLEMKHIYKDYYQESIVVPALTDINMTVDEGEYVAIMGPSGSGKTTLMNLIGCLDRPTKGEYLLEGESIINYSENRLSDVRLQTLGFVFQSFNLLSKQSALDNVALPLSYAGISVKDRRKIAFQALKKVGLEDRVHFRPNQLSGGQQQRVAIARALVNSPKIILADEPTGALDSKSGIQVMKLFKQLNSEGVTVIMITHDANIASNAKRILHIFDGKITKDERREADPIG